MRRVVVALTAAFLVTTCGHQFDVEKVLKITDVRTGWYDAGIQDGKNKLVPSISLKLHNVSNEPVESVQVNAIFRQIGDTQAWGEHFVTAIDRDGLPPGQTMPSWPRCGRTRAASMSICARRSARRPRSSPGGHPSLQAFPVPSPRAPS